MRVAAIGGWWSVAIAAWFAAACDPDRDTQGLTSDTVVAPGDVSLDSATAGTVFHGVKYPLTSENYGRWLVAQAALDSLPEPVDMPRIELRDPTDDDIDRTVAFLTSHDDERRAIEKSGLSVKDFVLTSIALGQAFNFSHDELVPRENRDFVKLKRPELAHARMARDFHVLDDDDDDDGDDGRGHGGHGHRGGATGATGTNTITSTGASTERKKRRTVPCGTVPLPI